MVSTNKLRARVPTAGICIFIAFYFVAAYFYPGGSFTDKTFKGFSWVNNYWCDLLMEKAKNGENNAARPIAITSWIILCFSISIFLYSLPLSFAISAKWKNLIRYGGITTMLVIVFLFTSLHDEVIQAASLLGFIVCIAILTGLYKSGLYGFFSAGLCCLILMSLNYAIMATGIFAQGLPLIQKITLLSVLVWILLINRNLINPASGNIS